MRLPSHVGHGKGPDPSPALITKPGRSEYWHVGQITDVDLCWLRAPRL